MSFKNGLILAMISVSATLAMSGCTKEEPKPGAQLNKAASDVKAGADQAAKDAKAAADSAAKQASDATAASHK